MSYHAAAPVESRTYRQFAISTLTPESAAQGISLQGGAAIASAAWPLANLAIYVPIYINEAVTIYEVGTGTGATAGGNFDIGLYQMDGTKLQSTGTQARTAAAWNTVNWTDLDVTPGWYYAAMSANGVDAYSGIIPAAGLCESVGIVEQTTAFVLPSPATISTRTTRAFVPHIAFACRSIAL